MDVAAGCMKNGYTAFKIRPHTFLPKWAEIGSEVSGVGFSKKEVRLGLEVEADAFVLT